MPSSAVRGSVFGCIPALKRGFSLVTSITLRACSRFIPGWMVLGYQIGRLNPLSFRVQAFIIGFGLREVSVSQSATGSMTGGGAGFGTGTYADRGQLTAVAVRGRGDEEATANRGEGPFAAADSHDRCRDRGRLAAGPRPSHHPRTSRCDGPTAVRVDQPNLHNRLSSGDFSICRSQLPATSSTSESSRTLHSHEADANSPHRGRFVTTPTAGRGRMHSTPGVFILTLDRSVTQSSRAKTPSMNTPVSTLGDPSPSRAPVHDLEARDEPAPADRRPVRVSARPLSPRVLHHPPGRGATSPGTSR